jgi:hypothetical protein
MKVVKAMEIEKMYKKLKRDGAKQYAKIEIENF